MSCRLVGPSLFHSISPPATPTTGEKKIQKETAGQGCKGIRKSSRRAAAEATKGLHMLSLNGVQWIVGVPGLKNDLDTKRASGGSDLRFSNGSQNTVDVAGSNGVLDPTACS